MLSSANYLNFSTVRLDLDAPHPAARGSVSCPNGNSARVSLSGRLVSDRLRWCWRSEVRWISPERAAAALLAWW